MEPMLNGSEKVPAQITDYKEYHTDKTVKVRVFKFRELCKFLGKNYSGTVSSLKPAKWEKTEL